jgi:hypothetical protein
LGFLEVHFGFIQGLLTLPKEPLPISLKSEEVVLIWASFEVYLGCIRDLFRMYSGFVDGRLPLQ